VLALLLTPEAAIIATAGGEVVRYTIGPRRPYLHPLRLPGGPPLTADAPADHPHHHGLWVGHHRVDSGHRCDGFYLERPEDGRIVHLDYSEVVASGPVVGFGAHHRWEAPDGYAPLADYWDLRCGLYPNGDLWLDFRLTLWATASEVCLRSTNEAALPLIRVAEAIDGRHGGVLTSSRGGRGERFTFGRRAEWCDYAGPALGDRWAGLAIFDHPANPAFPSPWFTRDYGPFGPHSNYFDGDLWLTPYRPLVRRYRIVIHQGPAETADLPARWRAYAYGDALSGR